MPGDNVDDGLSSKPQLHDCTDENGECVICFDNAANILFVDCGHVAVCAVCAAQLTACPVCRKRISNIAGYRRLDDGDSAAAIGDRSIGDEVLAMTRIKPREELVHHPFLWLPKLLAEVMCFLPPARTCLAIWV